MPRDIADRAQNVPDKVVAEAVCAVLPQAVVRCQQLPDVRVVGVVRLVGAVHARTDVQLRARAVLTHRARRTVHARRGACRDFDEPDRTRHARVSVEPLVTRKAVAVGDIVARAVRHSVVRTRRAPPDPQRVLVEVGLAPRAVVSKPRGREPFQAAALAHIRRARQRDGLKRAQRARSVAERVLVEPGRADGTDPAVRTRVPEVAAARGVDRARGRRVRKLWAVHTRARAVDVLVRRLVARHARPAVRPGVALLARAVAKRRARERRPRVARTHQTVPEPAREAGRVLVRVLGTRRAVHAICPVEADVARAVGRDRACFPRVRVPRAQRAAGRADRRLVRRTRAAGAGSAVRASVASVARAVGHERACRSGGREVGARQTRRRARRVLVRVRRTGGARESVGWRGVAGEARAVEQVRARERQRLCARGTRHARLRPRRALVGSHRARRAVAAVGPRVPFVARAVGAQQGGNRARGRHLDHSVEVQAIARPRVDVLGGADVDQDSPLTVDPRWLHLRLVHHCQERAAAGSVVRVVVQVSRRQVLRVCQRPVE
mmetsp:Transcript_17170/g.41579  ORF Transcript_17170/g.41579 Transcript_17170/m.41579 type:complete len:551 (-) Transcript_17170:747-2399(-)